MARFQLELGSQEVLVAGDGLIEALSLEEATKVKRLPPAILVKVRDQVVKVVDER